MTELDDLCFACGVAPVPPLPQFWQLAHVLAGVPLSARPSRLCPGCKGAFDDAMHISSCVKYHTAIEIFYPPGPQREAIVARIAELFEGGEPEAVARRMADTTAFLRGQFPGAVLETVLEAAIGLVLEGLVRRGLQRLQLPPHVVLQ
jgi:hypothetical protein